MPANRKAALKVVSGTRAVEGVEAEPVFESKYEAIFNQASDPILTLLPTGRIDAANQAMEELTGYMKSELEGKTSDLLVPDPGKTTLSQRNRPLTPFMLLTPGTHEDVAITRKDGYIRYVDVRVRLVSNGEEKLALAIFRDMTEKKSMERELITKHAELKDAYFQLEKKNAELQSMQETLVQSGKLAALGELAAGIAHELNQPLTGIKGYAQELQTGALKPAEVDTSLKEIVSNVDKMSAIIGYLRTFVRKSTENYEEADVHHAIEESLKMLSRQFASRGITVERRFDSRLPKVYANPLQLEQVFINLATNARDAIEATGRGRGQITISTRAAGDFVEIVFQDDGTGMSDKTKNKAFNPFFTTKEVGKGMGLGLSLSYGILSKIQGSIVVESEWGKGAAFRIRIPRDFRELA
jgi:PAS domain S-box-containing protein